MKRRNSDPPSSRLCGGKHAEAGMERRAEGMGHSA